MACTRDGNPGSPRQSEPHLLTAGTWNNVVRIIPPLVTTAAEVEQALRAQELGISWGCHAMRCRLVDGMNEGPETADMKEKSHKGQRHKGCGLCMPHKRAGNGKFRRPARDRRLIETDTPQLR